MNSPKIHIPEATLIERVNRQLTKEGRAVRTTARLGGPRTGVYYIIDPYRGGIHDMGLDLEALGRELGVLAANEWMADP